MHGCVYGFKFVFFPLFLLFFFFFLADGVSAVFAGLPTLVVLFACCSVAASTCEASRAFGFAFAFAFDFDFFVVPVGVFTLGVPVLAS